MNVEERTGDPNPVYTPDWYLNELRMTVNKPYPRALEKRTTLRVPGHLYQMIADTAEMEGTNVNWWIVKTLGAVFNQQVTPRNRQNER